MFARNAKTNIVYHIKGKKARFLEFDIAKVLKMLYFAYSVRLG